jgi:hypothetical protein
MSPQVRKRHLEHALLLAEQSAAHLDQLADRDPTPIALQDAKAALKNEHVMNTIAKVTFFDAIDPTSEASREGRYGELGQYKFQARTMEAEIVRGIGDAPWHVPHHSAAGSTPMCHFAVIRRPDTGAEVACMAISDNEWREETGVPIEEVEAAVAIHRKARTSRTSDLATCDPLDPSFGGLNIE